LQTGGIEDQRFDFAVGALGGQPFPVEFKIERADVTGLDHDFFGGVDGLFGGSAKTAAL